MPLEIPFRCFEFPKYTNPIAYDPNYLATTGYWFCSSCFSFSSSEKIEHIKSCLLKKVTTYSDCLHDRRLYYIIGLNQIETLYGKNEIAKVKKYGRRAFSQEKLKESKSNSSDKTPIQKPFVEIEIPKDQEEIEKLFKEAHELLRTYELEEIQEETQKLEVAQKLAKAERQKETQKLKEASRLKRIYELEEVQFARDFLSINTSCKDEYILMDEDSD